MQRLLVMQLKKRKQRQRIKDIEKRTESTRVRPFDKLPDLIGTTQVLNKEWKMNGASQQKLNSKDKVDLIIKLTVKSAFSG